MKYSVILIILAATASSIRAESPFEREFKQLREQRDKTVAAAVEPINRRYQASLDQLFRRATQGSDLDTALKVKAELQALTAPAPAASPARPANVASGDVIVAPKAPSVVKVRSSNLVLSPEAVTWDEAVQWCAANRVQMLSYANWADEKNRGKINEEIGQHGVWIGLTYDFDQQVWLDVDGSVVPKPTFNPQMSITRSAPNGGLHAQFVGGKSVVYDAAGNTKNRVLGTKIP